jgi:chemotaxis protein MotB
MKTKILSIAIAASLMTGCVSKKKYTELETKYNNTVSTLQKERMENERLESQMNEINMRVERYNAKIASLRSDQEGMMVTTEDGDLVLSEKNKKTMRETLKNVPASRLAGAETLKDSLDVAISYNMSKRMGMAEGDKEMNVNVDRTVVMMNLDDDMLFRDSSYKVGSDADAVLERIAKVVKSEPSLEVMIVGHTDDRTVKEGSYVKDNWDLSTERSAAIVRRLEEKYGIPSEQLIVAGRGSYDPVVANDNNENRAKNRRTQIIIMPNLDKFFAMLDGSTPMSKDKM